MHEELLDLAAKKKDVLIVNNISALEEIVDQERILLKKVKGLESKREASAGELAKALNIKKDRITMDEVEKHMEGEV